jgi:hypothetical protein
MGIGPFQWVQPFNRFAPFQSFEWFDKLTMSGVILSAALRSNRSGI